VFGKGDVVRYPRNHKDSFTICFDKKYRPGLQESGSRSLVRDEHGHSWSKDETKGRAGMRRLMVLNRWSGMSHFTPRLAPPTERGA